jgi:MacB-like periplasmic core domain
MLRKNRGSSLLAVLILALGIGGTTAVFSVADKVLLNPIPGRNSDRLVTLREVEVMHDSHWQVSPPLIEELATHSNLIESLTYCFQSWEEKKFRVGAETMKLRGVAVAPNFFELLELRPLLGRAFLPREGNEAAEKTIVLSHGLWQQYFGGDPQIIGQDIELDQKAYSVVGIMPGNVQFPFGSG